MKFRYGWEHSYWSLNQNLLDCAQKPHSLFSDVPQYSENYPNWSQSYQVMILRLVDISSMLCNSFAKEKYGFLIKGLGFERSGSFREGSSMTFSRAQHFRRPLVQQ